MYFMKGCGGLEEILKWPRWYRVFALEQIQKRKDEEMKLIGEVVGAHLKGIGQIFGG
jgi:hypothetical protein